MKVERIKSQCNNIVDFIEMNILDVIRNDESIDNIDWVQDLLDARSTLLKAVAEYEGH